MSGTKAGGLKAKQTNLQRDPDFYKKIGRIGGQNGHTGGFAYNPALARVAGQKGGRKSRRGPSDKTIERFGRPIVVDDHHVCCIICHKVIEAKRTTKLICGDPECKRAYNREYTRKYRAFQKELTK